MWRPMSTSVDSPCSVEVDVHYHSLLVEDVGITGGNDPLAPVAAAPRQNKRFARKSKGYSKVNGEGVDDDDDDDDMDGGLLREA